MQHRSTAHLYSASATGGRVAAAARAYRRFLPHQFAKLLGKTSIADIRLGDHVEQNMTILFADIRDFTSLSESMTPRENFRFVNSYLREMEPALFQWHGFVDKYIGDAIMAIFPTSADDALRAALAMLGRLRRLDVVRRRSGDPAIRIGIGLNGRDCRNRLGLNLYLKALIVPLTYAPDRDRAGGRSSAPQSSIIEAFMGCTFMQCRSLCTGAGPPTRVGRDHTVRLG